MTGVVRNPILPGCHPDPSVCRVGEWYYLVTSTFEYAPGLPVHRSRDMVTWEHIGFAFHDVAALAGVPASGGLYAPTIRHHDGTFFVVCTLVHGRGPEGHFVVTATDPAGPWSEPVWLEGIGGIDPSLTFHDGRIWLCGTRLAEPAEWFHQTEVWLRELSPAFEPIGDEHVLWNGALRGAIWAEGPHLYRHGDGWLLLAAEGGTERDHAVCVAYADEITGPYRGDPANPRLSHRDLGTRASIVNVGHADLVDDWAVALAVRTVEGTASLLGRETWLAPVEWEDGRPVFAPGVGRLQTSFSHDAVESPAVHDEIFDGSFAGEWYGVRGLPAVSDGRVAGGGLPVPGSPLGFVARPLPFLSGTVSATFDVADAAAGLLLRADDAAWVGVTVTGAGEAVVYTPEPIGLGTVGAGPFEVALTVSGWVGSVTVRGARGIVTHTGIDLRPLSTDARPGGFTGAYVGPWVVGDGHADVHEVRFSAS